MTNTLIRRLINVGYNPENALLICRLNINDLSALDRKISVIERDAKCGLNTTRIPQAGVSGIVR